MGLFGLLKRGPNQPTDTAEIVALYQRLRPVRLRLNNELVGRLSRDALEEGGKKLGILRRGMFVFDNEDESAVLMDYCIHDVYRSGRNAIDQYLEDNSPDPESDEMACLQAMSHAKYALVIVTRIEPGVGCHIQNLFTDETRLLVDMGFSETARPGVLLATRLLDFGAFVTTTGAALPLGVLSSDESEAWQRKLSTGRETKGTGESFSARGATIRFRIRRFSRSAAGSQGVFVAATTLQESFGLQLCSHDHTLIFVHVEKLYGRPPDFRQADDL